jgi:hypothetical protein
MALGTLGMLGGDWAVWLLVALALGNVPLWWRSAADRIATSAGLANPSGAEASHRGSRRRETALAKSKRREPMSRGDLPAWARAAAGLVVIVTLGPALCYPTGWDELVYHHELSRRWHVDGWPAVYLDLPYSAFPSLGETLFWMVAPIETVISPRLVIWICWIAGLAIVYCLLRRRLAAGSAAALALAAALSNAMLLVSANCYVEPILALNVAAILFILRDRRLIVPSWRRAIMLGVLAGGAGGVKLTGLAILPAVAVWFAAQERASARRFALSPSSWSWLPRGLVLVTAAAVMAAPFYLRPWLLTGNPVYPYFEGWFTSEPARLEMSRFHHDVAAAYGLRGPAALFQAPVFLAFQEGHYDGALGWQWLIVLVLAAMSVRLAWQQAQRPLVLGPLLTSAWLYVCWYFTAQQARFAIPALIAILPAAALGLRRLRGRARAGVLALLLVATAASVPWRTAGHYFGSWATALGLISRAAYVNESTDLSYLPLIRALDEYTPRDAQVLLLFEHRGFYVPRSCQIGTPFFQEGGFTPPEAFATADRVMELLDREQATHVVLPKAPIGPDQLPEWINRTDPFIAAFTQCVQRGELEPLWQSEEYALFRVR